MRPFSFHRPRRLSDAVELLESRGDAKALAGGQSLLPTLRLRLAAPSDLVDLAQIDELRGLRASANEISIGAMTRHEEVAGAAQVQSLLPALATLAGGIGDRQVRNRGTIGGSLANNDPAACYPAAALALDAIIHTDRRSIKAVDFFNGLYATSLEPSELITRISFPVPARAAYLKFKHPASRFALVGVFIAECRGEMRVAVTGAGMGGVFRATAIEKALQRSFSEVSLRGIEMDAGDLSSDLHAGADYRAHLILVLARRAVAQLTGQ